MTAIGSSPIPNQSDPSVSLFSGGLPEAQSSHKASSFQAPSAILIAGRSTASNLCSLLLLQPKSGSFLPFTVHSHSPLFPRSLPHPDRRVPPCSAWLLAPGLIIRSPIQSKFNPTLNPPPRRCSCLFRFLSRYTKELEAGVVQSSSTRLIAKPTQRPGPSTRFTLLLQSHARS